MKTGHFKDRKSRPLRLFTWERTWHEDNGIRFARYVMWQPSKWGPAYESLFVSHVLERRLIAQLLRRKRVEIRRMIAKGPSWPMKTA